jgi:hypothetical protein
MWSPADIVEAAAEAIRQAESRLREEQSTDTVDAMRERELQDLLEAAFRATGWTVEREVRYPSCRPRSRASGARCDLVLTSGAPMRPDAAPSLFDPMDPTPPEGACWIELKSAAARDVEGPTAAYARTLSDGALRDAATLAGERAIRHGIVMLVLFGTDAPALQRDVDRWIDETLATGIPVGQPRTRFIEIRELRGNAVACVACVPVSPAPRD